VADCDRRLAAEKPAAVSYFTTFNLLEHIRRPRNTPTLKLEAALKCRLCPTPRYSPPVHMIKLTKQREIDPYLWVHLDEERWLALPESVIGGSQPAARYRVPDT
jgi:hypothetical protein